MTKLDKRDHTMPGWVSHGPVQINVARDLHIHGQLQPQPPRHGLGSQLCAGAGVVAYNGGRLIMGALTMALLMVVSAFSLGVWGAARVADLVLLIERKLGGAHNRIIAAPAKLMPLLGVSALDELEDAHRLESDYDHAN